MGRRRTHRSIIDESALAPLLDCLLVQSIWRGQVFERSLRSLYLSSDGVRGRGATMKYLAHIASRNVGSAWLIPLHSGTRQLASDTLRQIYGGKALVNL